MSTESVKIEKATVDKVRKVAKKTKQSIGGIVTLATDAYVDKEIKRLKIK
jgi:predicted transcriptional regulator